MSAIIFALGIAMIVVTFAEGGGPLSLGVILGVMLAALGAGRLWLGRHGLPGGGNR
jgi:uncharacterized membrane protein